MILRLTASGQNPSVLLGQTTAMAKTKNKIEVPASAELKEVLSAPESEELAEPAAWLERLRALIPTEKAALITVFGIGFLMFFPYLGALGLWDCWEPHYGEV